MIKVVSLLFLASSTILLCIEAHRQVYNVASNPNVDTCLRFMSMYVERSMGSTIFATGDSGGVTVDMSFISTLGELLLTARCPAWDQPTSGPSGNFNLSTSCTSTNIPCTQIPILLVNLSTNDASTLSIATFQLSFKLNVSSSTSGTSCSSVPQDNTKNYLFTLGFRRQQADTRGPEVDTEEKEAAGDAVTAGVSGEKKASSTCVLNGLKRVFLTSRVAHGQYR